jgi:predicted nucleic-acid-binding protein
MRQVASTINRLRNCCITSIETIIDERSIIVDRHDNIHRQLPLEVQKRG